MLGQARLPGFPCLGQESMLITSRISTSSCTGSGTGEMALAAVAKTINDSGYLARPVHIHCAQSFEVCLAHNEFMIDQADW